MITEYKRLLTEISSFGREIKDLKSQINALKESLTLISRELTFFARKESVKELEKYINLWQPLNFTTEDDVKRIIREEKRGKNSRERGSKNTHYRGWDQGIKRSRGKN